MCRLRHSTVPQVHRSSRDVYENRAGTGKMAGHSHGAGISRCHRGTRDQRHSSRQCQESTPDISCSCTFRNSRSAEKITDSSGSSQSKNASPEWFLAMSASCIPDCHIRGTRRDERAHRSEMSFACCRTLTKLLPVRTPPVFFVPGPVNRPAVLISCSGTARSMFHRDI